VWPAAMMAYHDGPQFLEYAISPDGKVHLYALGNPNGLRGGLQIPDFCCWSPLGGENQSRVLSDVPHLFFHMHWEGLRHHALGGAWEIPSEAILRYERTGQMKPHRAKYWMYTCAHPNAPDIWVREKIPHVKYLLNVVMEFPNPQTVIVSLHNLAAKEIFSHISTASDNVNIWDVFYPLRKVLGPMDVDMERLIFIQGVGEKAFSWGVWDSGAPKHGVLYSVKDHHAHIQASVMVPKPAVIQKLRLPASSDISTTNKRITCKTGLEVQSAIRLRQKTSIRAMFIDGPPYRFVRSHRFVKRKR